MVTTRIITLLFATLTISLTGMAQPIVPDTPDATVRFVSQDGDVLQRFEFNDGASFARVREALQAQLSDPANKLVCVRIRSAASPDGNTDTNRARSDQRADDTRLYLTSALPELNGAPFIVTSAGEDYESLRALLEQSDIPGADRAAEIIRTVPLWVADANGNVVDGRKKQLMDLRGGETWNAMRQTLFPQLQRTRIDFLLGDGSTDKPAEDGQTQAAAQNPAEDVQNPVSDIKIYFPVGDATLRENFRTNAAALAQLQRLMDNRSYVDGDLIHVVGLASPEGSERLNETLARRRAESIRKYITSRWPAFANAVSVTVEGEAWADFRAAVQSDTQLSENESLRMLDIIDSDTTPDAKEAALRKFSPWQRYYRSLFPDYRAASILPDFVSERFRISDSELLPAGLGLDLAAPAITLRPDQLTVPQLTAQKRYGEQKRTILAVKTNLLYDAATMLNYAIELPLGDRFSLVWEHYSPWWVLNNNRICVQYLTLGGEARWWFARKPRAATAKRAQRDRLVGHYLGAYGFWGKTDLQWDRIGCYQCENVWSAGLTYGYVFPISRHLNLELSASIGYASIPYQRYIPSDDWQTLWRDPDGAGVTYYFGPTKIQVGLVWPIQITTRAREGARR